MGQYELTWSFETLSRLQRISAQKILCAHTFFSFELYIGKTNMPITHGDFDSIVRRGYRTWRSIGGRAPAYRNLRRKDLQDFAAQLRVRARPRIHAANLI